MRKNYLHILISVAVIVASLAWGQLEFDGVDSGVVHGNGIVTATASDTKGAWSYWFSLGTDSGGFQTLHIVQNSTAATKLQLYADFTAGNDNMSMIVLVDSTTKWRWETANEWTDDKLGDILHLVVVQDGTSAKFYVDGVDITSSGTWANTADQTAWMDDLAGASSPADMQYLGRQVSGTPFDGKIYSAQYFPHALTASEVAELYRTGAYPTDTDTVVDWSGNDKHGSMTNATYNFQGARDYYTYNGSSSHIVCDNDADVQITNGTISTWIRTSNAGASYRGIFIKEFAYGLFVVNNNDLMAYEWGGVGELRFGYNPVDGSWHHVAMEWTDGLANGTRCYVDGVLVTNHTRTTQNQTKRVTIGENAAVHWFTGDIGECIIWDSNLTSNQIYNLYNGTYPTNAPVRQWNMTPARVAPVAEWGKADGLYAAGDTIVDVKDVASTNDGTYVGAPTWGTSSGNGHLYWDAVGTDYIDLGEKADFEGAADFTVGAWVKHDDTTANRTILHKYNGSVGWTLYTRSTGKWAFYVNGTGAILAESTTSVATDDWYFLTVVIDRSSATDGCSIYVNGILETDTGDGTALGSLATAQNCAIGQAHPGGGVTFKGYNRETFYIPSALTSNQVFDYYNATRPTNSFNGLYTFDRKDNSIPNYGTAGSSADGVATNGVKVAASVPSVVYDDSVVVDWSGNGRNGTNGTAVWGQSGNQAYYTIDSTADELTFNDTGSALAVGTGDFTIYQRFRPDNIVGSGSEFEVMFSYGIYTDGMMVQFAQNPGGDPANTPRVELYIDGNPHLGSKISGMTQGQWYDVIVTRTSGTANIYIDGVQYKTGTRAESVSPTSEILRIGRDTSLGSSPLEAGVSRFMYWTNSISSNTAFAVTASNDIPAGAILDYTMTPPAQPSIKQRSRRN